MAPKPPSAEDAAKEDRGQPHQRYLAIAQDPPDGNYRQLTTLGPVAAVNAPVGDSYDGRS